MNINFVRWNKAVNITVIMKIHTVASQAIAEFSFLAFVKSFSDSERLTSSSFLPEKYTTLFFTLIFFILCAIKAFLHYCCLSFIGRSCYLACLGLVSWLLWVSLVFSWRNRLKSLFGKTRSKFWWSIICALVIKSRSPFLFQCDLS